MAACGIKGNPALCLGMFYAILICNETYREEGFMDRHGDREQTLLLVAGSTFTAQLLTSNVNEGFPSVSNCGFERGAA